MLYKFLSHVADWSWAAWGATTATYTNKTTLHLSTPVLSSRGRIYRYILVICNIWTIRCFICMKVATEWKTPLQYVVLFYILVVHRFLNVLLCFHWTKAKRRVKGEEMRKGGNIRTGRIPRTYLSDCYLRVFFTCAARCCHISSIWSR